MGIVNFMLLIVGICLAVFAMIKDIQTKNLIWAIADILILPVGMVRAFFYLFSK